MSQAPDVFVFALKSTGSHSIRSPARGPTRASIATLLAINVCCPLVLAQNSSAQVTPPVQPPAPPPSLSAPAVRATGARIPLRVRGAPPGTPVVLQRAARGRWVMVRTALADADGSATLAQRPVRLRPRYRLRIVAGASTVVGAHPHVLQPIRRPGGSGSRRLVAYSLGNFVWSSSSALTSRAGILRVRLSARGLAGARLLPAVIEGTRPRLRGT